MVVEVRHEFVNAIPDDPQAEADGETLPSHWNAAHDVSGIAEATHTHAGEDIASGTVADARVAATVARDSEVAAAISAHEAAGNPHPGSGGELVGPPTAIELVNNAFDATGLHYVLIDGEGGVDDFLDEITGGVDGQLLVVEYGGAPGGEIRIRSVAGAGTGDDLQLANKELAEAGLGEILGQVICIYSAAAGGEIGRWWTWSLGSTTIHSPDGNTEVGTTNEYVFLNVASLSAWIARAVADDDEARGVSFYMPPVLAVNTAPADGDLVANGAALWFDPTDGAASPMWKGKSADGTVVSGNLGGVTPATDPGAPPAAIADPTLATAEDVALKLNALQAWAEDLRDNMLAAGMLA